MRSMQPKLSAIYTSGLLLCRLPSKVGCFPALIRLHHLCAPCIYHLHHTRYTVSLFSNGLSVLSLFRYPTVHAFPNTHYIQLSLPWTIQRLDDQGRIHDKHCSRIILIYDLDIRD